MDSLSRQHRLPRSFAKNLKSDLGPSLQLDSRNSTQTIFVLCCRSALAITLFCIVLNRAVNGSPKGPDFWFISLLFSLPYAASETVARKLPKDRMAGLLFMFLILAVSGIRLFLTVVFTLVVMQPLGDTDNMIGILPFIEVGVIWVQLGVTALFGVYALWTNRRACHQAARRNVD